MTPDEAMERAKRALWFLPTTNPTVIKVACEIRRAALEERLAWLESMQAAYSVESTRRELEALDLPRGVGE